jgi:putative transposase
MRAITHRRVMGMGPLYQGRFKSLPVQDDAHLLTLLRYVQRNPVRAKLTPRASQWGWGAEGVRARGPKELRAILSPWPIDRPKGWASWVNQPPTPDETDAIRACIRRSSPFGDADWTRRTAEKLSLQWTLQPRGRPEKVRAVP